MRHQTKKKNGTEEPAVGGHSTAEGHVPPEAPSSPVLNVPGEGEAADSEVNESGEIAGSGDGDPQEEPTLESILAFGEKLLTDGVERNQALDFLGSLKAGFAAKASAVKAAEEALRTAKAEAKRAGNPIAQLARALDASKVNIDGEIYFPAIDNRTKELTLRTQRGGSEAV